MKSFDQFMTEKNKEESNEYQKFFKKALDKFGVEDPGDLEGDKKKEFYDYVDDNWESEEEDKYDDDKSKDGGKQ